MKKRYFVGMLLVLITITSALLTFSEIPVKIQDLLPPLTNASYVVIPLTNFTVDNNTAFNETHVQANVHFAKEITNRTIDLPDKMYFIIIKKSDGQLIPTAIFTDTAWEYIKGLV